MRRVMDKLKLTVNEEKTDLCELPRERFDFLGYTFGRCYSRKDGHAYIGTRPSKKSVKRMVDSIGEVTDRRMLLLDAEEIVGRLNTKLTGWARTMRAASTRSGVLSAWMAWRAVCGISRPLNAGMRRQEYGVE